MNKNLKTVLKDVLMVWLFATVIALLEKILGMPAWTAIVPGVVAGYGVVMLYDYFVSKG